MKTKNYLVKFYKKAKRQDDKDSYLGSVEVDDAGVNNLFPIQAKAFRQAPPRFLEADLIRVEQVS